ncbi:MAG TPA: hypothetical protein VLM39_10445, partial [Ignavibacteriaceae bacterium]|nr:hypothetical protein [Ignavibacteriaceae bacterium]
DPELKIEDFDLWLRLSEFGEFFFLPRIHAYYRIHSNQFSADWEKKKRRLEYLAKKKNLPLQVYKFRRNKNFILRITRGLFHFLNYVSIEIQTFFQRLFNRN